MLIIFQLNPLISAQSVTVLQTPGYKVIWVGQIRGASEVVGKRSFFSKLFDLATGRSKNQLVQPKSVKRCSLEQLAILDQGARSLSIVDLDEKKYNSIALRDCLSLVDLTLLPDGTILFTDSHRNMIFYRRPDVQGTLIFNSNFPLQQPTGIAYSAITQHIYVSETAVHRLSVFDIHGNFVNTIGMPGRGIGEFNFPTFITIDGFGNIYVVDSMNFRIQILNPQGTVVSCFGKAGDASGDFARPKGIACDSFGHIFVVDGLFHNIQIFDSDGNFLEHFGKQGHGPGEFWLPSGIEIDQNNTIYVADTYNGRIQIFQLEVTQ
jgi:hypothetical protein